MPKNIVVFSDGTGQDGGKGPNTNVYKLFNMILDRSPGQISFYDPGLGTGWRKATGNIAGRGFSRNVRQCYEFIFENYQAGDKIFLFGFSRGAATVRSLTGFLHLFGVLPRSRHELIGKAWKIYKMRNNDERKERAREFVDANHTMWTFVEFLGVWDTVAALGLPDTWFDKVLDRVIPHGFHDFSLSQSVKHACHALAIDDVRKTFHPVLFERETKKEQTLRQVWFMGMHTDVGGGYEEKELSDIVLEWMVQHAVKRGLRIFKPADGWKKTCTPDADGFMHDSRKAWWKKRVFPKKEREWNVARYGRPVVHESVTRRTKTVDNTDGEYGPWIMKHEPEIEPWSHLSDWRMDPGFAGVDPETMKALEGWCVPAHGGGDAAFGSPATPESDTTGG